MVCTVLWLWALLWLVAHVSPAPGGLGASLGQRTVRVTSLGRVLVLLFHGLLKSCITLPQV